MREKMVICLAAMFTLIFFSGIILSCGVAIIVLWGLFAGTVWPSVQSLSLLQGCALAAFCFLFYIIILPLIGIKSE